VKVFYSLDGADYRLLRLAYLSEAETLQVGVMCAALIINDGGQGCFSYEGEARYAYLQSQRSDL